MEALCLWKNLCSWKNQKQKDVLGKKERKRKQAQRRKKEYHSVKKRKIFLCESDWCWRSSMLASRFRLKKRPEKKKFRPVRDLANQSFMPSFHHCLSSVHYCEDRFHIHAFLSYLYVTSSRKMFEIVFQKTNIFVNYFIKIYFNVLCILRTSNTELHQRFQKKTYLATLF